jgi:hypothetical protein
VSIIKSGFTFPVNVAWTVNQGWVLATKIAANLDALTLLGLHDQARLWGAFTAEWAAG